MSHLKRNLPYIILLILIGVGVYAFNFNNALFWDDDDWIRGNIFVHDFSHVKDIFTKNVLAGYGMNSNYYRPLLLLTFAFNYVMHGMAPFGYHLLSNGFHIANAILVFLLLLYVFKKRLPAFLAALIYVIHPLNTEAVAYISGRGDPMSVFFMLLALWLFVKAEEIKKWTAGRWALMGSSVVSVVLGILSRETAVLFPGLLLVFYIAFISKGGFWESVGRGLVKAIPYIALSAVYGILRLTVLNFHNTLNWYNQSNVYTEHLSYRLYTFGHALVEYFRLALVPVGLHMERYMQVNTSPLQWPVWLGILIVAAIIAVGVIFYRNSKSEARNTKQFPNVKNSKPKVSEIRSLDIVSNLDIRISDFRIWFFSWAWFAVAIAPVSGIVPINALLYEHWLYLPLIGLCALAGFYLDKLFEIVKNTQLKMLLMLVLTIYLGFFVVMTVKRNIIWGDKIAFYEDIISYGYPTARIMNNLANAYSDTGQLDKAAQTLQAIIAGPEGRAYAQPYYNLGNIYQTEGDIAKAMEQYQKSVEVDPNFYFAYQNMAVIYARGGDWQNAAAMLEKVKSIRPEDPVIYGNLTAVYLNMGNKDLARENYQNAARLAQGNQQLLQALAQLEAGLK